MTIHVDIGDTELRLFELGTMVLHPFRGEDKLVFLAMLMAVEEPLLSLEAIGCPPGVPGRRWVTERDYPKEARKARMQGVVEFTLEISPRGCATSCRVTRSSGHALLDERTCQLMMARARFKPKLDDAGNPTTATWSNEFTWALP